MNQKIIALLIATIFGVVACGSDSDMPAAESSLPAVADGYTYPTGVDDVVIEFVQVGGFVPRELAFQSTPSVLVSGDGRTFGPGAQIAIYPGPLLPAVQVQSISDQAIQTILSAADDAGLFSQIEYDQPTDIADAATARLTINVNGQTYVHEAYALNWSMPGESGTESTPERQALADFIGQLSDLAALVGAEELGEQTIFDPADFGIEAIVVDDPSMFGSDGIEPTILDWPSTVGVRLSDADSCTVVPADEVGATLNEANQLTFFVDADVTYQVLAKPILPGTSCD